jgi:peroxiredoxin
MNENVDLEREPIQFAAKSSKAKKIDAHAFRGKVPVVMTFVGPTNEASERIIADLNLSLVQFGRRRVQLLVVVDDDPYIISARLDVHVPLICDHDLTTELGAEIDKEGRIASVIIGNDGMALDVVRQLPIEGQAAAILVALDRLTEQFPERFTTLPDDADPLAIGPSELSEVIEDPTRTLGI